MKPIRKLSLQLTVQRLHSTDFVISDTQGCWLVKQVMTLFLLMSVQKH
ncbi:hypothetical protein Cabther_A1071 [Chloracidobacterium thermophilum B]|uniref:Uncharacterized protein n=1 Tax=Chloracidobacterium thermophilum (strain B) TaxID=981222 RepID=G2LH83_CHLTF|nr:hypothetical protein Cabther_A1071 [Chloracidobacterium thermophilum B]